MSNWGQADDYDVVAVTASLRASNTADSSISPMISVTKMAAESDELFNVSFLFQKLVKYNFRN